MVPDIVAELQTTLSKKEFETITSFILLYTVTPTSQKTWDKQGSPSVFGEKLEERYKRKFLDCHKVLSITREEVEHLVHENESERD